MAVWRKFGQGIGMVWLGALLGLVLGTAFLELLFPDVPVGVRFVVWGTVVPAPVLFTIWFYGQGRPEEEADSSGGPERDRAGLPGAG